MKYQDFVIKNGKFIGKFEEMYKKFPDPWKLLKNNSNSQNINYQIIYNYCEKVRYLKRKKKLITLEIGCGYPQITYSLFKKGFKSFGTDISETVITKSKKKYSKIRDKLFVSEFDNLKLYEKINPDIIIFSDISWYILPELKKFLKWFKKINKKTYLIHSLAIYEKNVQSYGKDYFYDMQTIKNFFNLKFLSQVEIKNLDNDWHTIFLASNKK
jgi:SAM-dependent methyltransferase